MEAETIKITISRLGKLDFTNVYKLIIQHLFNAKILNIDGPYDGGSDWITFDFDGAGKSIAFQDTSQKDDVEDKALDNAKTAKEKLNAVRFVFGTSQIVSNSRRVRIEGKISSEVGIPFVFLDARIISEYIYDNDLVPKFLDAIDAPLPKGFADRPDRQEMTLNAYTVFSKDAFDLKHTIYEDSICIFLKSNGPASREETINGAISILEAKPEKGDVINRRIDSLLAKSIVLKNKDGGIELSERKRIEIENSERLYLKEISELSDFQEELFNGKYGIEWSRSDSEIASTILSRLFIHTQLFSSMEAGAKLTSVGLVKHIGDPRTVLEDFLYSKGLRGQRINSAIKELCDYAIDSTIVKKLARASLYTAIEGANVLSVAKALGAGRWSDIIILLDASVAIPFLCSKLYMPTQAKFFQTTFDIISRVIDLESQITISYNYLDEAASHLFMAYRYQPLVDEIDALMHSENAYISSFFSLKKAGAKIPPNLYSYLRHFAPSINPEDSDWNRLKRMCIDDLSSSFREYGVNFEEFGRIEDHILNEITEEYAHYIHEHPNFKKSQILLDHDARALAYIKKRKIQNHESRIILTWDRSMIDLGKKIENIGWIVSPDILCDFIQPFLSPTEKGMCSISHRLVQASEYPQMITAKILDTIVALSGNDLKQWEFKEKLDRFKKHILSSVDYSKPEYMNWIEKETEKFVREELKPKE